MTEIDMALALANPIPSGEPCAIANPRLWLMWCELMNRDPMPSEHWTEGDVVNSLVAMDLLQADPCGR